MEKLTFSALKGCVLPWITLFIKDIWGQMLPPLHWCWKNANALLFSSRAILMPSGAIEIFFVGANCADLVTVSTVMFFFWLGKCLEENFGSITPACFYMHITKCSVKKSYIFLANGLITKSLTHKVTPSTHCVITGQEQFPNSNLLSGFALESLLCICSGVSPSAVVCVEGTAPSSQLLLDWVAI